MIINEDAVSLISSSSRVTSAATLQSASRIASARQQAQPLVVVRRAPAISPAVLPSSSVPNSRRSSASPSAASRSLNAESTAAFFMLSKDGIKITVSDMNDFVTRYLAPPARDRLCIAACEASRMRQGFTLADFQAKLAQARTDAPEIISSNSAAAAAAAAAADVNDLSLAKSFSSGFRLGESGCINEASCSRNGGGDHHMNGAPPHYLPDDGVNSRMVPPPFGDIDPCHIEFDDIYKLLAYPDFHAPRGDINEFETTTGVFNYTTESRGGGGEPGLTLKMISYLVRPIDATGVLSSFVMKLADKDGDGLIGASDWYHMKEHLAKMANAKALYYRPPEKAKQAKIKKTAPWANNKSTATTNQNKSSK